MFLLRFDMRAPLGGPASTQDLYSASLDMAAWGEEHGCLAIVLSEHHASEDGYLPSPLVLAAAMAARTKRTPLQVAAILLPLHDPLRLAEDMAVLDLLSEGRVSYVTGVGYRPEEYAMFDRPMKGRGKRMEACLEALRSAWTGEPFTFEGRTVTVTPTPMSPGGPMLLMGGNSEIAVKRAAKFGMGILTQGGDASLTETYHAECARLGTEPGPCIVPETGTVTTAFIAEDPDQGWSEVGPHLLHDANMYASWAIHGKIGANISRATSVDELRAENGAYRVFTPEEAIAHIQTSGPLVMQPLCGGTPPEFGWKSLQLYAERVAPALT